MKTDVISIDNRERGFSEALSQTLKAAAFRDLNHKQTLQLRLCTEEMLSLARSVTGELTATFWLESEGKDFELHLSTKTVMDAEKRKLLIDFPSSAGFGTPSRRPWSRMRAPTSRTRRWTILQITRSRSRSGTNTSSRSSAE